MNNVLSKLDEKGVFEFLGKEETHKFLKEIVNLAQRTYDCNSGEILESYTSRFQICYICLESSENLHDGLCAKCAGELQ